MSSAVAGGAASTSQTTEYRLPTDVVPTHYELAFKTDLESKPPSFLGEAMIDLDIKQDVKQVVFNLNPDLKVTNIGIKSLDQKTSTSIQLPMSALSVDKDQERGKVDVSSLPGGGLKAGSKAKLFLRWEAELGDNMMGYYKSEGDADADGKKQMWVETR